MVLSVGLQLRSQGLQGALAITPRERASALTCWLGSPAVSTHSHCLQRGSCFLQVTCLALSKSGKLLASGQVTTISGLARIVIWDLQTATELRTMDLHQVC